MFFSKKDYQIYSFSSGVAKTTLIYLAKYIPSSDLSTLESYFTKSFLILVYMNLFLATAKAIYHLKPNLSGTCLSLSYLPFSQSNSNSTSFSFFPKLIRLSLSSRILSSLSAGVVSSKCRIY